MPGSHFNSVSDTPTSFEPPANGPNVESTQWLRLPSAEPIRVRDPLAELLGTTETGTPLTITFADIVTAAGHACPAVSGAYRATQLALKALYSDSYPVRSEIAVTVGAPRDEPGYGPMANVIRFITGAADETGFVGFDGYGGRNGLLSFEDRPGEGRTFDFTRTDTVRTVRVTFDPSAAGIGPPDQQDPTTNLIPKLVDGRATEAERTAFYEAWHDLVSSILKAEPESDGPFTVEKQ